MCGRDKTVALGRDHSEQVELYIYHSYSGYDDFMYHDSIKIRNFKKKKNWRHLSPYSHLDNKYESSRTLLWPSSHISSVINKGQYQLWIRNRWRWKRFFAGMQSLATKNVGWLWCSVTSSARCPWAGHHLCHSNGSPENSTSEVSVVALGSSLLSSWGQALIISCLTHCVGLQPGFPASGLALSQSIL